MYTPRNTITILAAIVFLTPTVLLAENPIRVTTEENTVSIYNGSSKLIRYGYRNVPYKPCVQQLFTPGGINILRDSPADHKHHHALMYAISVDGLNFWEEQKKPGRQQHKSFLDVTVDAANGVPGGEFTEKLDWINPLTDDLLLNESRMIRVCQLEDFKATLLSWHSSFSVPFGKDSATLSGSHYFGLGMRFVESIDTGARFRNSSGETGEVVRGDERLTRANWCSISGQADGKLVTVAIFCHPDNLRHPTHWFTMAKPFAYLSATMNLHRQPLEIAASKPLMLRYGVALWDGQADNNIIEQLYRRWIENY